MTSIAIQLSKQIKRAFLAGATLAVATAPQAFAQLTLYDQERQGGQSISLSASTTTLSPRGFNDKASSLSISGGDTWQVCEDGNFRGRCALVQGSYGSLRDLRLNNNISSVRPVNLPPVDRSAPITLFSGLNGQGVGTSFRSTANDLSQRYFNRTAQSVRITSGVWALCTDRNGRGDCTYIDASVSDLRTINLANRVQSIVLTPYDKAPSSYDVVLYRDDNTRSEWVGLEGDIPNLSQFRFNDQATMVEVNRRAVVVCEDVNYRGYCAVARQGLSNLVELDPAFNDRISSVRAFRRGQDRGLPELGQRPVDTGGGFGGGIGSGTGYGGGYEAGFGEAVIGNRTVFYPHPRDAYDRPIPNRFGTADAFCRDMGFRGAVYAAETNDLSDVLCER